MSAERAPERIRGQLALFKYAGRMTLDTFCVGADDGWNDVIYYYNQGEVHPKQSKLFNGKLGHKGNDTHGDVTEAPYTPDNVVPLIPDNVVELHPREVA